MVPEYLVETKIIPNPEYKKEQNQMRNDIKVLDPSFPRVSIFDMKPGEMFRYVDSYNDGSAAYMKVDGADAGEGDGAVYLPTGRYYNISPKANLSRISLIQIGTII